MSVRKLKPVTPAQRFRVVNGFDAITTDKPEKSLLIPKKRTGGRNNRGKMTVRYRGGGHKRMYRIIDFKRNRFDQPAEVLAIEYDPNRSARLALLQYEDKQKTYILAPLELKVGDKIQSSKENTLEIKAGNCMPLKRIPLGTAIHNIELKPGKGGQIARSAGTSATLMAKEGDFAFITDKIALSYNEGTVKTSFAKNIGIAKKM